MTARLITADDLLDVLPIVADEGWGERDGAIRNLRGECPMCAFWRLIGYPHGERLAPWKAARLVGLYDECIEQAMSTIVLAADFDQHPYRARLRAALGMRQ